MILSVPNLSTALDALNRPMLWWGILAGVVFAVSAFVCSRVTDGTPIPSNIAGIAGAVLSVVIATIGTRSLIAYSSTVWWTVVAAVVFLAASFLPTAARLGLMAVGSVPMAMITTGFGAPRLSPTHTINLSSASTVLATFLLGVALVETTRHGRAARLFPPLALVSGGLFLCLPETSAPLTAFGFLVPIAILSLTRLMPGAGWRASASAALAPPMVVTVVLGLGPTGERVMLGGLACLAVVAVWVVARVLRRSPPGPPLIDRWFLTAGVALATVAISRLAVVRSSPTRTIVGSVLGLGALGLWCVVGEVAAARRLPASPPDQGNAIDP